MIDSTAKLWCPCNVYPTAMIGKNVSIGSFAEVGHQVRVGDGTRIGGGTFIPEGVSIGENCFIGPHVCFTNDRYPPSESKDSWEKTVVESGAAIGAGSVILCGVVIGSGAIVGAGSVVVGDVKPGAIVAGNPAKVIRMKTDEKP